MAGTEKWGLHHPWTDDEIVLSCCAQSMSLTVMNSSTELAEKCQSHSNLESDLSIDTLNYVCL